MVINDLNPEALFEIITEKLLFSFPILKEYMVTDKNVSSNTVVTKYISYDLSLQSMNLRRKMIFNLIDYYTHQRINIKIHNTEVQGKGIVPSFSLIDYLEKFCAVNDSKINIVVNNRSEIALGENLQLFLDFIKDKLDERFFKILEGKAWVEIPINWEPYK